MIVEATEPLPGRAPAQHNLKPRVLGRQCEILVLSPVLSTLRLIQRASLAGPPYRRRGCEQGAAVLKLPIVCLSTPLMLVVLCMAVWVYVVNNLEQLEHREVRQDGVSEFRDYPVLVVAKLSRRGDRATAASAAFRSLAGYIFAKDRAGKIIAMTARVTQQPVPITMSAPVTQAGGKESAGDSWVVVFIMPAQPPLATLPPPRSQDARLRNVGPARRAAIRFSGVAADRLRNWLGPQGRQASPGSTYVYQNDPFTPAPLRRNEVIIDLLDGSDAS